MSILESINNMKNNARLSKNIDEATFWSLVISEINKASMTDKGRVDITDESVLKVLKKLNKEIKETSDLAITNSRPDVYMKANNQLKLIDSVIPDDLKDISEEVLRTEISKVINSLSDDDKKKAMKFVMPELKNKFGNRVDGKLVSKLVNELK